MKNKRIKKMKKCESCACFKPEKNDYMVVKGLCRNENIDRKVTGAQTVICWGYVSKWNLLYRIDRFLFKLFSSK